MNERTRRNIIHYRICDEFLFICPHVDPPEQLFWLLFIESFCVAAQGTHHCTYHKTKNEIQTVGKVFVLYVITPCVLSRCSKRVWMIEPHIVQIVTLHIHNIVTEAFNKPFIKLLFACNAR